MKKPRKSRQTSPKSKQNASARETKKLQEELKLLTPQRNWPEPTTFSHRNTTFDFLRK